MPAITAALGTTKITRKHTPSINYIKSHIETMLLIPTHGVVIHYMVEIMTSQQPTYNWIHSYFCVNPCYVDSSYGECY